MLFLDANQRTGARRLVHVVRVPAITSGRTNRPPLGDRNGGEADCIGGEYLLVGGRRDVVTRLRFVAVAIVGFATVERRKQS